MSRRESKERNYTSARERAEKQSTGFTSACLKIPDGVTMFKPKLGTMLIDILPYEAGEGNPWADKGNLHWERTYYAHRGVGANGDTVLCPRMNSKERCPICEHRSKLMKEGDEDNEALVKDLSPKQRQLFNVINLKDPDKGVQLWDISYFLFGKLLDARLRNSEDDDDWDKFFFLEGGLTLKIGFEEKSFGGRTFCEVETIDFKQRKEDYDEEILVDVHCLDEVVIEQSYEEVKKLFLETRDDDDDEKPAKKRREVEDDDDDENQKPVKSRKQVDDDDLPAADDDEKPAKKKSPKDDDDWSDFDDDDEKPKKKAKPSDDDDEEEPVKKKSKPADDDDDNWEPKPKKKKNRFARQEGDKGWDNDDDEAEEKPKKKKHRDEEDE